MREVPIIRIHLERMEMTLAAMLTEELAKMDEDVRAAVKRFCTPENVRGILDRHVQSALEAAIRKELSEFFEYGKGRKILRKAIEERFAESEEASR